MYKHNNYGKFIDTERKYSPAFIGDLIFPNAHVKSVITAYASGEVRRPLILFLQSMGNAIPITLLKK